MTEIVVDNIVSAVKESVTFVLSSPTVDRTTGEWCMQNIQHQPIYETHSLTIKWTDPLRRWHNHVNRGLLVELFDILLGLNPGHIHQVWPFYNKWRTKNGLYPYTYGQRIRGEFGEVDQWQQAVNILRQDKTSRHAFITIRRPIDILEEYTPCSIGFFFQLNNAGRLDMTWLMRSNDLDTGGMLRNLFIASHIHEQMSLATGIPIGTYYHYNMNTHIYSQTQQKVQNMINDLTLYEGELTPATYLTDTDKQKIATFLFDFFEYGLKPDDDNPFFTNHTYFASLLRFIFEEEVRWEENEIAWLKAGK